MSKSPVLLKVSLGWHREITEDQVEKLKNYLVDPTAFATEEKSPGVLRVEWTSNEITIFADDLPEVESIFRGDGKGEIKVIGSARSNAVTRLIEFGQHTNTTVVNEKCHVAVAGLGLLTIDTVEVRTDYCTESLQRDLLDGWRILAICVQPDQRRPDYILGKTEGI